MFDWGHLDAILFLTFVTFFFSLTLFVQFQGHIFFPETATVYSAMRAGLFLPSGLFLYGWRRTSDFLCTWHCFSTDSSLFESMLSGSWGFCNELNSISVYLNITSETTVGYYILVTDFWFRCCFVLAICWHQAVQLLSTCNRQKTINLINLHNQSV